MAHMQVELAAAVASKKDSLQPKKSVHFNLSQSSHSALRIACFKSNITMQDFFDEIALLVESESPIMTSIIGDISTRKKSKQILKLAKTDSDSLYNIIENELSMKK